MLLDGDRVPVIARKLFISQSTVRNHLSSVFRKLRVHGQQELIHLLNESKRSEVQSVLTLTANPVAATCAVGTCALAQSLHAFLVSWGNCARSRKHGLEGL